MTKVKAELYIESDGKCSICGRSIPISEATLDHIYPKSKGGKNTRDNLRLACLVCNSIKNNRTGKEVMQTIRSITGKLRSIGNRKYVVVDAFKLGEVNKEDILDMVEIMKKELEQYKNNVIEDLEFIISKIK